MNNISMTNELTMADNSMMLMGAMAFLALSRGNAIKADADQVRHFQQEELKYNEVETDTLTLIGIVDVTYLNLKMKVDTLTRNMGPTITDKQDAMIRTCDSDHYCLSLKELARLLKVKPDYTLIAKHSKFCKMETEELKAFFKKFE
jgi:hypothetical protein